MSRIDDALKQLVNVKIELDGVEYPNDYAEQLAIDRTSLEDEFLEHSKRYAYYATLAELAEDRHQRAKEDLERLVADLDHEIRAKAEQIRSQNDKFKLTETMIEKEILIDPRYQRKLSEIQNARHLAKVLKAAPMAFAHRRDMLIELGKTAMSTVSDPRVSQGKQKQVQNMFAAKSSAPSLPAHVSDTPDEEFEAIANNLLGEINAATQTEPPSTSRRRPRKTNE